jgi:hypothetical protein
MQESAQFRRAIKFGVFEADFAAGELRKNGTKIRLQDQPFQVLALTGEDPAPSTSKCPAAGLHLPVHGSTPLPKSLRPATTDSPTNRPRRPQ